MYPVLFHWNIPKFSLSSITIWWNEASMNGFNEAFVTKQESIQFTDPVCTPGLGGTRHRLLTLVFCYKSYLPWLSKLWRLANWPLPPCCCLLNRIGHPTVLALSPTLDYQEFTVSARYDAEILCLIRTFDGPFSRQETRRGCLTRPLPTIKSPLTRDDLASTTEASEKHGRSHHP